MKALGCANTLPSEVEGTDDIDVDDPELECAALDGDRERSAWLPLLDENADAFRTTMLCCRRNLKE